MICNPEEFHALLTPDPRLAKVLEKFSDPMEYLKHTIGPWTKEAEEDWLAAIDCSPYRMWSHSTKIMLDMFGVQHPKLPTMF